MDLLSFRQLVSPGGLELLNLVCQLKPKEEDYLLHFQRLSRQFSPNLVQAALETAILRQKASVKFPFAEHLFFTRDALEQASAWDIAFYRAKRYARFERVFDLGCSVGCDSLALSQFLPTIGLDRDPLRLAMAQANLRFVNRAKAAEVILADLNVSIPVSWENPHQALFFDPARREDGKRLHHVEQYQPPLHLIQIWRERFPNLGVKVSPAVNLEELSQYDCEVEFISRAGELKEAVLWFGELRSAAFRATILPTQVSMSGEADLANNLEKTSISPPRQYLYEPDPAILRARLVRSLATQLNAGQLDADIAFLTSDQLIPTPFARVWEVEGWMSFNVKKLREYLRSRNVGKVTVKKRGSPVVPQELEQQLKLKGTEERILFLTHYDGKPIVIVAHHEIDNEKF